MTDIFALEITMLTPAEASAIWKRQTKRAGNYADFVRHINAHDVGATWNVKVPDSGDKNADQARAIKMNFNEAAKERTRAVVLDPLTTVTVGDAKETTVDGVVYRKADDGKFYGHVPAPVIVRWKANTHKVQREVVNDKGKKGTVEVVVIDSLDALIVASEAVKKRGPRVVSEEVTPTNAPGNATAGATVTLPDGRTATLSKAGKWRAPKLTGTSDNAASTLPLATANGSTDVSAGNNEHAAEENKVAA
jgi:hypothetical protein